MGIAPIPSKTPAFQRTGRNGVPPPLSGRLVKNLAPRKEGPLVSSLLTPGEKKVWVGGDRKWYLRLKWLRTNGKP